MRSVPSHLARHRFIVVLVMMLSLVGSGCGLVPELAGGMPPVSRTAVREAGDLAPSASPQVTTLPTLDPSLIERGRQVYQASCASCHGANAEGAPGWQKVDASGNFPPPPHDDSGHTWHHPDRVLFEMIRDGMADPLRPGSPLRMPAFKDKPDLSGAEGLSDADISAAIMYFKSLWSPEHRAFQSDLTQQDLQVTPKAPTPSP